MSSYDELIQKCEKPPYTWGSLGSGYCVIVPASDPIFDLLGGDDAPAHAELICLCVNEYAQLRTENKTLNEQITNMFDLLKDWTPTTEDGRLMQTILMNYAAGLYDSEIEEARNRLMDVRIEVTE